MFSLNNAVRLLMFWFINLDKLPYQDCICEVIKNQMLTYLKNQYPLCDPKKAGINPLMKPRTNHNIGKIARPNPT